MATSKPKTAYRTDQRKLSLLVYASARGTTRARLEWGECLAGEERIRPAILGEWEWPRPVNTRQEAIACLVWVARKMADQAEASGH